MIRTWKKSHFLLLTRPIFSMFYPILEKSYKGKLARSLEQGLPDKLYHINDTMMQSLALSFLESIRKQIFQ